MKEPKIGDKIRILHGHVCIAGGQIATLVDPARSIFGASKENPNVDPDGDYWCKFEGSNYPEVCIHPASFELVEGEEDVSH